MNGRRLLLAPLLLAALSVTALAQVSTRTVSGTLRHADGSPWAGAAVKFELTGATFSASSQFPAGAVTTTTDPQGHFSVTLWTNSEGLLPSVKYKFTRPDGSTAYFNLTPGDPVDISTVLASTVTPTDTNRNSLLALVDAHAAVIAGSNRLGHVECCGAGLSIDGNGLISNSAPGVLAHSQLTGLGADDHPQYFNQARGDARYSQLGHGHAIADISDLQAALDAKAALSHTHTLSQITDAGSAASKNTPASGNAAVGEVVLGSDTRLSDARTPTAHTHAESDITNLVSDLSNKQPLNSNLTTIAGLAPAANDLLQFRASAWVNRTPAQFKVDLALTKGDVGLGNVLNVAQEPAIAAGLTTQVLRGDKTWLPLDTSVVPENGNLYWTQARFNTAFSAKTTDNLTEGTTNLYFTNARASAAAPVQSVFGRNGAVVAQSGDYNFNQLVGAASNSQLPATLSSKSFDDTNTYTAKDGSFTFENSATPSKKFVFDLSNLSPSTTRTVNVPDANSTTAQAKSATSHQFLTAMSAQGLFSSAQPSSGDIADFNSAASAAAPVQSVAGHTGAVILSNTDISGLGSFALKNSLLATDLPGTLNASAFGGNVTLNPSGTATSGTQYPSYDLVFQDSGWNTTTSSANTLTHTFRLIPGSGATGAIPNRLALLNNAGTEYVTFDGLNQRLGVNTSAPDSALTVAGAAARLRISPTTPASQAATLSLFRSGITDWTITHDASNNLNFARDGVSNLFISSAGLVGVNNSTPGAQLHVLAKDSSTKGFRVGMAASPSSTSYPFSIADSTDADLARFSTTGQLFTSGGGTSVPNYSALVATTNGVGITSNGVSFIVGGSEIARASVGSIFYSFANATQIYGTINFGSAADASISRNAAGIVQIGNGGANANGSLLMRRPVTAKTANYTVVAGDSNTLFPNTGATGEVDYTLPTVAVGETYTFCVDAAQVVKVIAGASTTITIGASTSASAGNVTSSTAGSCVTLTAITTGKWFATTSTGSWTVN